jgi:hypothetical protein
MDGLWSLDHMHMEASALCQLHTMPVLTRVQDATVCLTDPSLTLQFTEDILYALLKHSKKPDTAVAFYHTVQPSVKSPEVVDALFEGMCKMSITEAFFFARGYDDTQRRHLFEQMLLFVHSTPAGDLRGERAVELIPLPLDTNEEKWFEDFLLHGEGKSLNGAADSVIMRKIATGRQSEAAKLTSQSKNRKVDGVNWTSLTQNM